MNMFRFVQAFNVGLAIVLPALAAPLGAQSNRATFWGYVALGAAGAADSGFYASTIGLGVQRNRILGMARVGSLDTKNTKRMEEFGVMAGFATRPGRFHLGAVAGIGEARDSRDSTAVSIPMEAHATLLVTRWTAIGARVFGSINELQSFGGITVTLQLGRLRP